MTNLPKEATILGSLIFWIIVGGIAGALAKLILPGDDPGGFIITILLGIAGAIVGGFLGSLIGAVGVVLAKDLQVELILIGAVILGFLGIVNGIGSTRR